MNKNKPQTFFLAKIHSLTYHPSDLIKKIKLRAYDFRSFNVNKSASIGQVIFNPTNRIAFSKWVTPKRTRSYPFARIYDTYHHGGKVVTIIPVIKDEGAGASKNKSNNDRINFVTLSWMNLMNIYVILGWYSDAKKKSKYRITDQRFEDRYIRDKLETISTFKLDAHHWNNKHFTEDFSLVLKKASEAYEKIGEKHRVSMHPASRHIAFLDSIRSKKDSSKISLEKFADVTLGRSQQAAVRESSVTHQLELLGESSKGVFQIENNLGGKYYLTADEIFILPNRQVIIQESKNSSRGKLPSQSDVKDGLFKILLFSQISELYLGSKRVQFSVQLKLTGKLKGKLVLPCDSAILEKFIRLNGLGIADQKTLRLLNEESKSNHFRIVIQHND